MCWDKVWPKPGKKGLFVPSVGTAQPWEEAELHLALYQQVPSCCLPELSPPPRHSSGVPSLQEGYKGQSKIAPYYFECGISITWAACQMCKNLGLTQDPVSQSALQQNFRWFTGTLKFWNRKFCDTNLWKEGAHPGHPPLPLSWKKENSMKCPYPRHCHHAKELLTWQTSRLPPIRNFGPVWGTLPFLPQITGYFTFPNLFSGVLSPSLEAPLPTATLPFCFPPTCWGPCSPH